MRTYEALYIISPELDDAGIQTTAQEVENLITTNNGAVVRSEIWGKRKLAYEVKNFTDGVYVLLRFDAGTDFIKKLEGHFRLADAVIRYLVVNLDEHDLRLEAEQNRRNIEEMQNRADRDDDDDDDDDVRRPARAGSRRDDRDDD